MAKVDSSHTAPALGEEWIVRVLQGIDVSEVARHVVVRLDDRRVCLTVVSADASEESWGLYSKAAAKRAAVDGDRVRPLLASGRTDEWFYVAYDVDRANPLSALDEVGAMSGAQCIQILHGIARGLDQAAAAAVYPTELTPDSVFADARRGAVLADLGLAREALGNPSGARDRDAPWVAPEVLGGEKASERSAVYSFGALMYTLLTGDPPPDAPSLRALRPDLPEALDTVVVTAMARDPRRRYRTAAETFSLANILLQGDLVPVTAPEPPPRPAAGAPPEPERSNPRVAAFRHRSAEQLAAVRRRSAGEAATLRRRVAGATAAIQRRGAEIRNARTAERNGRPAASGASRAQGDARLDASRGLLVALAGGVVVAGALAGVLLAGPGPEAPPAPKNFSRGGLQIRLPGDWKGTVPVPGALAAHPVDDPGSGLTLEPVDAPVEREEQGNPVRLGGLEAWREAGVGVAGARAGVRYVIPTESGKLVATCRASPRAAPGTLAGCERVASTLRLRSATGLPIAAVVEQQERWGVEVARLGRERSAARRSLARATRPAGQRLAALALVRVHDRAAARFAAMPDGKAVAAAARRTARSYRVLAWVSDGQSSQDFNAARTRVRRSEAALRQALAESQ